MNRNELNLLKRLFALFLLHAVAAAIAGSGVFAASHEMLFASYGLLSTVAGSGSGGAKDVNYWNSAFEGGRAVDAELSRPHMAMADSAGNIYIADKDAHAIRKVDINGIITTVAGTGTAGNGGEGPAREVALNAPNGVWVNKYGVYYILDLNNAKIRKVDEDGNMTTIVVDSAGIPLGRGLWVSASEDTIWYACGSQVRRWTAGEGIGVLAAGFSGLGNLVQDRNGAIVATDRAANCVYRIDGGGNKTVIAGTSAIQGGGDGEPALQTAFYGVRGVWFLEDNSYFLATHEGSQVWYIDVEGTAHIFVDGREGDEYHSGDGEHFQTAGAKVSEVRAVTVDYQGNVLITENDEGYIRKVARKDAGVVFRQPRSRGTRFALYTDRSTEVSRLTISLPDDEVIGFYIVNRRGQVVPLRVDHRINGSTHSFRWCNARCAAGWYHVLLRTGSGTISGTYSLY